LAAADAETRESLAAGLCGDACDVETASSECETLDLLRRQDYAVCVVDLASADGGEILARIHQLRPQCFLIALTCGCSDDPIPAAKTLDVLEWATKPCSPRDISTRVRRLVQLHNLQRENAALREQVAPQAEPPAQPPVTITPGRTLEEMEKLLIAATIQHTGGNIKGAAAALGIDRSTLYEKIKRYGIPRP